MGLYRVDLSREYALSEHESLCTADSLPTMLVKMELEETPGSDVFPVSKGFKALGRML